MVFAFGLGGSTTWLEFLILRSLIRAYARRKSVPCPQSSLGRRPAMQITDSLFLACCQCPFKAFLKSKGEVGKILDYEAIRTEADARFTQQAVERLVADHAGGIILRDPPTLSGAVEEGASLILGATINALDGRH